MTDRVIRTATPIASVEQLVGRFAAGGKSPGEFRIGVEHEKIGVLEESGDPVPYDGPRGIEALLRRLAALDGWQLGVENDRVVSLSRGPLRVSLEPGGQLELSGDPLPSLRDAEHEIMSHLDELRAPSVELGIAWLGIGFRPFGRLDDIPWVPKGRYAIMRTELAKKGRHGHDMMKRTATVQANLDYSDEADAERKLRAAMSVTSIVTALFAASPLADGKDTGYASYRAAAWLDTDPDRCGLLPFAFEAGQVFRRYTEWALDVPLLFLYRQGEYRTAGGATFRRFLAEGLGGERATLEDWDLHLSTLFPEARLKNYLEVRGADAGPLPMVLALPALWKGLLYDEDACRAATALTAHLSFPERQALREAVPRQGLAAAIPRRGAVRDAARELVAIARAGLTRAALSGKCALLEPLDEVVGTGRAPADRIRDAWRAAGGDRKRLVAALRL
jgi:glutamate--cysteine ligase